MALIDYHDTAQHTAQNPLEIKLIILRPSKLPIKSTTTFLHPQKNPICWRTQRPMQWKLIIIIIRRRTRLKSQNRRLIIQYLIFISSKLPDKRRPCRKYSKISRLFFLYVILNQKKKKNYFFSSLKLHSRVFPSRQVAVRIYFQKVSLSSSSIGYCHS